jgi:hypothetical protein
LAINLCEESRSFGGGSYGLLTFVKGTARRIHIDRKCG